MRFLVDQDVYHLTILWLKREGHDIGDDGRTQPSDREALCEDFIRRAQSQLEPQREELDADVDRQVKDILTAVRLVG